MKPPVHILLLEDDPQDAALLQATLEAERIACVTVRAQSREDFLAALERGGIDLILADFSLPNFDGMSALNVVRAKWPSVPFIFVSGTIGEELAVNALKNGATDYVMKERLSRLGPAIRRAMQEVEQRCENRRAQEELLESEQRLRIIFDESPLGIALIGPDGHPVLVNGAFQRMLGYTVEELRRMHFTEFAHPDDRAKTRDLHEEFLQGARSNYQVEKRCLRKDGRVVWTRASVGTAHSIVGDPGFAVEMIKDVTERRNLEAKFIEAQKMEVIGHLAGGVAHDFNNILAVIMGYSELSMQNVGLNEAIRGYLETIRSTAERASGLTRQLLVFSRRQPVQLVVLDVNDVVKELDKMLRRLIDENIVMTILPGAELGHVKADSGYVGQVVMNLVINARDAMPNGGALTIATNNVTLDERNARAHSGAVEGDYVMISVSDTGTGMTDEVKAHLFEAFFTTKPKGKGTGLGLATCQTIVHQSGGLIELESEVGRGTTFKVYLPRVDQPLDTLASTVRTGPLPRGTETVLLVEDEPVVRHLASDVLEAQGYRVLRASNGQEGLQVARELNGQPIGLVITDVIMPQMGGKAMAEWLKSAYPDLKILFTSGYTDGAIDQQEGLKSGEEFLPKPYSTSTLIRKVREMFDR